MANEGCEDDGSGLDRLTMEACSGGSCARSKMAKRIRKRKRGKLRLGFNGGVPLIFQCFILVFNVFKLIYLINMFYFKKRWIFLVFYGKMNSPGYPKIILKSKGCRFQIFQNARPKINIRVTKKILICNFPKINNIDYAKLIKNWTFGTQ